jgi:hypothetical protein
MLLVDAPTAAAVHADGECVVVIARHIGLFAFEPLNEAQYRRRIRGGDASQKRPI